VTTKSPIRPDVTEAFVEAADATRLYLRCLNGRASVTALLCDGLVCDGFIYKYLWSDFPGGLGVAHWNYRGHGRSESPRDPARVSVHDHAQDLDRVRRHLGDPPVVLVGHSFGTQVALEAYRLRPAGVRGLVLVCGSFGRVTHTFHGSELLANVLPNLLAFAAQHPRLARAVWSRVPVRVALKLAELTGDIDTTALNVDDLVPYFRHATHVDFQLFLKMLHWAGEHSAEDLLERVDVPVLVIAGARDSFTPPELSLAMSRALPQGELFVVDDGSHVALLEHPDAIRARIETFLVERGITSIG